MIVRIFEQFVASEGSLSQRPAGSTQAASGL